MEIQIAKYVGIGIVSVIPAFIAYRYYRDSNKNIIEEKQEEEKRLILSPTFTEEDISDWRCRSLLVPHEVIRHGMNTLVEICNEKYYDMSNIIILKNKINIFYKWYNDIFFFCVYNHHNDEEDIYFPWIVKNTEKLPPKVAKQHSELIEMLNKIKNSQKEFEDITNVTDFKKELKNLNGLCMKLKDDMTIHLNEEEETIPVLLKKYNIQKEEEDKIVNKIVQNLGLSGNKIMLPWILDIMHKWGGVNIVNEFKKNVPPPILFINYMFWTKNYKTNNKDIVKQIMS